MFNITSENNRGIMLYIVEMCEFIINYTTKRNIKAIIYLDMYEV